jgi:hypothetical protein
MDIPTITCKKRELVDQAGPSCFPGFCKYNLMRKITAFGAATIHVIVSSAIFVWSKIFVQS